MRCVGVVRCGQCAIPGFPRHLRVYYVEQELTAPNATCDSVEYLTNMLKSFWTEDAGAAASAGGAVQSLKEVLLVCTVVSCCVQWCWQLDRQCRHRLPVCHCDVGVWVRCVVAARRSVLVWTRC